MPKKKDPRDAEEILKRWLLTQRVGNTLGSSLSKQNDAMFREINKVVNSRKSQVRKLKQVKEIIKRYKGVIKISILDQMTDFSNVIFIKALEQYDFMKLNKPRKRKVTESDLNRMINKHGFEATKGTLGKQINGFFRATENSVKANISIQALNPDTVDMIALQTATKKRATRQILATADTVANSVSTGSYMLAFKDQKEIKYLWISTLDHVTTPFCQVADGKIFLPKNVIRPPAHYGCRSSIIAFSNGESISDIRKLATPRPSVVPKSDDALREKGLTTRTGRARRPSRNDSSPLKGQQSTARNYEEFLKRQSKLYIIKRLGKRDGERFLKGESLLTVLKDSKTRIDFSSLDKAIN